MGEFIKLDSDELITLKVLLSINIDTTKASIENVKSRSFIDSESKRVHLNFLENNIKKYNDILEKLKKY